MSEVNVNGGERKRRLPLWMSGVTVPDQVEKSRSKDDENISSTQLNSLLKARKPKLTRVAKTVEKEIDGKDTLEVDTSLLVKDEAKKRVKKTRRRELDDDDDDLVNSEEGLPKKRTKKGVDVIKRKTKESTLPKKRNQKSIELGTGEETKDPSTSEDDEELTVEDLVSIAEEADKRKRHQKQAINEHESAHLPAVSDFSRNETVDSIGDAQSSRILPADITMEPSSTNDMMRSQNQVSSASNDSNPSRTGDPAQDMLDLFLGHLLKKPQTEERKPEFITHDIVLESEFRKHSGDGILGEKVVTLTKKKSSLKDKVAMFFD